VYPRHGLTGDRTTVVTTRSCRAPHQTISDVGLIGGGHVPLPGEVSRAHHGVLFLDEQPEYRRHELTEKYSPVGSRPSRASCHRGAGVGGHDSAGAGAKGWHGISPPSTLTGSGEGPVPRLHLACAPPAEEIYPFLFNVA
jgi:hypothetical protein